MSWVHARWQATPFRMFQKLRDVVERDFKAFKSLTGQGQMRRDQFYWDESDGGDCFTIIDRGDRAIDGIVRFRLDRPKGVIAIEWWQVPAGGGDGELQNRWVIRPVADGGPVPMLYLEPRARDGDPRTVTPEELSRLSLLDFFAGWE